MVECYHDEQEWQNYRTGLICAVLVNINRDPKKSKVYSPQDFMPGREHQKHVEQTPEEMLLVVKSWLSLYEAKR
jgi:hypothetical protein